MGRDGRPHRRRDGQQADRSDDHRLRHARVRPVRPERQPRPRRLPDAATGLVGFLRPRRLHALRLAGHLRELRRVRRLADARRLLPLDPLEQDVQVADGVVDPRLHVAELREPRRHRRQREVLGLDVRQLVPGDRRRDGRVGAAAHRVGGGDRAVARVLVVVDEDALAALLLPPRGRHELGAALDLAGERERAAAHDREVPLRLDPARDVDAAVAGRLRPARPPHLRERLAHDRRDALAVLERRPGLRVDVDPELVRLVDVRATRRPRVEVDDGEVRRPGDLRDLGHAELVGVPAGRERDARRLDPLGPLLGHPLLVDHLALDPVREAAQLRRALVERADDAVADREVVLDEIELRLAAAPERAPCPGSSP